MMASGFRVRLTGLVFVFKSTSLALIQVPTCIRKLKTNTFDKSIKFLYWLFLVVLDGFRSFQMVLGRFRSFLDRFRSFQIVLGRFSSFLTLVSTTCRSTLGMDYPIVNYDVFRRNFLSCKVLMLSRKSIYGRIVNILPGIF